MSERGWAAELEAQTMNTEQIRNDDQRAMEASLRESKEHGGQVVARKRDGTNLYAPSIKELYLLLEKRGIAPHEVSIDYVAPGDESRIF